MVTTTLIVYGFIFVVYGMLKLNEKFLLRGKK